ncbi:MAG: transposase [Methylotetracoccus sp.]
MRRNPYASLLTSLDAVLPWKKLNYLARTYGGVLPLPRAETLLRIYLVQQWFGLSDDATEGAMHDSVAIRAFAGLDQHPVDIPEMSELHHFRLNISEGEGGLSIKSTIDQCLSANRYFIRSGSRLDPVLVRYDQRSGHLDPLSEQFDRMAAPYQLPDILRFNAIYRRVYSDLNHAERKRAEEFVDRLIEGAASSSYIPRIFGVV